MSLNSGSIFVFVLKALREKSKRSIIGRSDATCQYTGKLRKIKLLLLIPWIFRYNGFWCLRINAIWWKMKLMNKGSKKLLSKNGGRLAIITYV